ncbi:MAG: PD-(D/E)XK nuclease family protein [Bacteroides sp.]|nr:PD-(D/E)XK nuclease family protein [Bacteroides sp.]
MNKIDLQKHEVVVSRLKEIYSSPEYVKLRKKLSQETYLSLISKDNSEKVFSSFICWLLNNPVLANLTDSPLLNLLRVLANNAMQQSHKSQIDLSNLMPKWLLESVMSNNLTILGSLAKTEIQAGKGFVDIVIGARVKYNSKKDDQEICKNIRIVLENKVYSSEHNEQCMKYYKHYSKKLIIKNREPIENIFCFLSIDKNVEISANDKYIKFNYQELLDSVLLPLVNHKDHLPVNLYFYISDFIDTLTTIKTDKKPQIAMTEETKVLLRKFFENNEDLIRAAILQSDDTDLQEAVNITSNSKMFKINFNGQTPKIVSVYPDLFHTVIQYLAVDMNSNELIKKFEELGSKYSSKNLISLDVNNYIDGSGIKRYTSAVQKRDTIICKDNVPVYVSNQLMCKEKNDNVTPFIDLVNKMNCGIKIEKV